MQPRATSSASFLQHAAQTGAARAAIALIGIGATVINARWLGVEGVGILALLILLKNFSLRLGSLGFGSAFAYFVARSRFSARQGLRLSVWLSLGLSVPCVIALILARQLQSSPWNGVAADLFFFALTLVPLVLATQYLERLLSGELKIGLLNVSKVLGALVYIALLTLLVVVQDMGLTGALTAIVLSDAVVVAYLFLQFPRTGDEPDAGELPPLRELWGYGRWNYLLMLLGFFTAEMPLILLKAATADYAAVGLFSRARGLSQQFRLAVQPFADALFPYTAASEADQAARRTSALCRNLLALLLPVVVVGAFLIEPIIGLLYGEEFLPAVPIFYALLPSILAWPVDYFLGVHIAAAGRPRLIFWISLWSVVVATILSYFLIASYGAVGAGASVSLIFVAEAVLRLEAFRRLTATPWRDVLLPRLADVTHYRTVLRRLIP